MTQNVHVIYREALLVKADVPRWTTYAYPDSIYVAGTSLEQVRTEFLDAARFHVDDGELGGVSLFEHVETLSSGVSTFASRLTSTPWAVMP